MEDDILKNVGKETLLVSIPIDFVPYGKKKVKICHWYAYFAMYPLGI